MDTTEYEKMKEAQERFHPKAMSIPGVHGTSIGLKSKGGVASKQLVIVVHLERKRPLDQVPANERIPAEIDGFATDVIEHDMPEPHEDNSKYRPVRGGIQLQVGNFYGTLGCIVNDRSDNTRCALSNQHVITHGGGVFQPKSDPVCDQIGDNKRTVLSSKVDGGISSLNSNGVTSEATIVDIGNVAGTYVVEWFNLPYAVQKRGRTTTLTSGRISSLNYSGKRTDGWNFSGQFYITANSGNFSEPGDSGSVVVDGNRNVVGLLWGGALPNAVCSPIADVTRELNVDVVVHTGAEVRPRYEETTLGKIEALLSVSAAGRGYWHAYRMHRSILRHRFHQTPRLYAVWLKIPQVELAQALTAAANDPDARIPATIGDRETIEMLTTLRKSLRKHIADEPLQRQFDSLYELVTTHIGARWRDVLRDDGSSRPRRHAAAAPVEAH